MDRAHSAAAQGCAVSGTPAARSAPAHSAGATPRVCSLWLLSLAQARESDSSARKADPKNQSKTKSQTLAKKIDTSKKGRRPKAPSQNKQIKPLPNFHLRIAPTHHLIATLALKRFCKCGHVRRRSDRAEFRGCVRVGVE